MKERIVRSVAGSFVLIGIALGYFVSAYWFLLPAFVGLNLLQSSVTKFCPLELFLDKIKIEDKDE